MTNKKFILLPAFLFPLVVILSQCLSGGKVKDPRGPEYAGAQTCVSCHKDISSTYLHTAHFAASLPATAQTIQGSVNPGENNLAYNDHSKLLMQKKDSGYYQTNYINKEQVATARMDIVLGGIKGISYLSWKENELFQLPVSYDIPKKHWIVSPGYDTTIASFDRMITSRCLECHASFAKEEAPKLSSFSGEDVGFQKSSLILSVDCERCHGPAKKHVDFQLENPKVKTAKYITKIAALTRNQKVDLCGTCHSGTNTITSKSIFDFKPGDKLSDFKRHPPSTQPVDYAHIDVHGDQLDMLKSSKCYMSSQMDCATCHNTHKNQRNDLVALAQRCSTCHTSTKHNECEMTGKLTAAVLKANCIACHMPALPSKVIVNEEQSVLVNTHHIAIYPNEVKKVLAYLKK